jgi:hypothetical protein
MSFPRIALWTACFSLAVAATIARANAQENYPAVNKGVKEFYRTDTSKNVQPLIERVKECWKEEAAGKTQDAIALCFALDYCTGAFDEGLSKKSKFKQSDFTKPERTLSRVNAALKEAGADQDRRGRLIAGWIVAANAMLLEYARRKGDTILSASAAENEPLFAKAKSAVQKRLKDPDAAEFQTLERLITPNVKGVPVEVVCGKISMPGLARSGPRPFVYLVQDGTAYYDSGEAGAGDQDTRLIRNFCAD